MTGYDCFNFPAFDQAAALGRSLGYRVFNPAEHDRSLGFDPTKNTFDGFDIRAAQLWDLNAITRSDFIALLPGWENSRGAKVEKAVAEWLGVNVLDATTFQPFPELVGA
jgi:hypothetical protein